jgi:hypothetical protein
VYVAERFVLLNKINFPFKSGTDITLGAAGADLPFGAALDELEDDDVEEDDEPDAEEDELVDELAEEDDFGDACFD